MKDEEKSNLEMATLAGGCFWCVEAVLEQQEGVKSVVSGYAGGHDKSPTYEQVCSGTSGHAEVVQVTFDPNVVSFESLLDIFWRAHDPTTMNRQGNDVGSQYRSAIFYHNEQQREAALKSLKEAQAQFKEKIVTEVVELDTFYAAEKYHQDFYQNNPGQGYCTYIIQPKLKKMGLNY